MRGSAGRSLTSHTAYQGAYEARVGVGGRPPWLRLVAHPAHLNVYPEQLVASFKLTLYRITIRLTLHCRCEPRRKVPHLCRKGRLHLHPATSSVAR